MRLHQEQRLDRNGWWACLLAAVARHAGWDYIARGVVASLGEWRDVVLRHLAFLAAVHASVFVDIKDGPPLLTRQHNGSGSTYKGLTCFGVMSALCSRLFWVTCRPSFHFLARQCSRAFWVLIEPSQIRCLVFVFIVGLPFSRYLTSSFWMSLNPFLAMCVTSSPVVLIMLCMEFSSARLTFSTQSTALSFAEIFCRSWQFDMAFSATT
jgi:hypothetical protein